MDFAHLHVHSYYSLMDGLNSPEELCEAAKDMGQTHLAITDHGTLSAHREMQEAAEKTGLTPILGVEAYLSPTDRFDRRDVKKREDNTQLYNHLIILAKDADGLKNLQTLSEIAWREGYYYKPRIDKDVLSEYGDGLIVLSGCLNGVVAKAIERGNDEEARGWLTFFKDRFGDDFYIELQPDNPYDINAALLRYADEYGIKPTVTADCHFARPEDRAAEEAMLILSTNPKPAKGQDYDSTKHIVDIFERFNALYPERPISFEKLDLFIRGRGDMYSTLEAQGLARPDMFDSTLEIADKIGSYNYPKNLELLPIPKGKNPSAVLRTKVAHGLRNRGLADKPEYMERALEELQIIEDKNFSSYFLIEGNMVQWAKNKDIMVGPGRGSAAGSLVCYALGITEVDPIKYGLLFFRFINPERNDFPDIDTDFEDRRRGEVKDYLRKQFKNVASISTYTYFKDKAVVRDAARVFSVPIGDVNKVMKVVETFEDYERSANAKWFRDKYPEVLEYARKLRGRIRSTGMHAAGVIVSREPIENYAPIETRTDPNDKVAGRVPVVAYDMKVAESIGFIKFDVLGLKTLAVISDTLKEINDRHAEDVDLNLIPLDDPAIYADLSNGFTKGVFQCEAVPYTSLLKEMKVKDFNDLAASNALVRPGAKNTIGTSYIARKQGREQTRYVHEIMEPHLSDTYGCILYQEQVMLACVHLGGMTMAEADKVRKIIGKKKDVREFDEYRERFVQGASQHVHEKVAEGLWHDFEAHAGYSFNKSHAVAYSLLSYWTAWLKHYYPLEFMYAILKNEGDKDKRTEYLIEAKRLGIKVLLPHVNKSGLDFQIEGDAIRFGLTNIKYISDNVGNKILDARPFASYADLQEKAFEKGSGINSRTVAALDAIGAASFDDNKRTGQEQYNYYEYLNIPRFGGQTFPDHTNDLVRGLNDYEEDETFVIKAMVKSIKRGIGWSRVEVVDETGSAGIFHNADTQIEPGTVYFILVAENRIVRYVPVDEVWEQIDKEPEDAFIKYLLEKDLWVTEGWYYVVRMEKKKTKAGKLMGNLVLANKDKEMRRVLVFPKTFGSVYGKIKEGSTAQFKLKKLEDGGVCLNEVI